MTTMQHVEIGDVGSKRTGRSRPAESMIASGSTDAWDIDPMDEDAVGDELVVTTRRRLVRLSVASTEVGARFERERLPHDPAAWMLTPRALFDGRPAIEACQDLQAFSRNLLLHGLGLGLDADPEDVDALLADDEVEEAGEIEDESGAEILAFPVTPPALLTCWVDAENEGQRLYAFCAMVTGRPADLVERVIGRFGATAAERAIYRVGFDPTTPLATAMLSRALSDTLVLVGEDPASPLAAGLDVAVEQRFHA